METLPRPEMLNKEAETSPQHRDERGRLLFYAKRSQRYHDHRRGFFESVIQWFQFLNLVLGSAGVVYYLGAEGKTEILAIAPAVAAVTSAILISSKAVAMAELHAKLLERCIVFEQRLSRIRSPTEADIEAFHYERLEIERVEPRVYHAVNRMCRNEVIRSEGTKGTVQPLGFWRHLFKDVWRFKSLTEDLAPSAPTH